MTALDICFHIGVSGACEANLVSPAWRILHLSHTKKMSTDVSHSYETGLTGLLYCSFLTPKLEIHMHPFPCFSGENRCLHGILNACLISLS